MNESTSTSTATTAHCQGEVSPGFEPLFEQFEQGFLNNHEIGASLCVYHKGKKVVDIWGGVSTRSSETHEPWQQNTLALMFSATKGLVATCFLKLMEQGLFRFDEPVCQYWPEFSQNGKAQITIEQLLNHQAGLCAIDAPLCIDDYLTRPDQIANTLAAQKPLWQPGSSQGYGLLTWGMYTSVLFKKMSSQSLTDFYQEHIAGPLDSDTYLTLGDHQNQYNIATLYPYSNTVFARIIPEIITGRTTEGRMLRAMFTPNSYLKRALASFDLGKNKSQAFNNPEFRDIEFASGTGFGSAEGLAKVYAMLSQGGNLDGVQILKPETIALAYPRQSWVERDATLHKPLGFSCGFQKEEPQLFSPELKSFGHSGSGGSLGWADPVNQLAIGYVHNKLDFRIRPEITIALCHAAYDCIEKL